MRSDFGFGLMLGLLVGLAFALLFGFVTQLEWVHKWQTLLTGGLAIVAAYVTVQPARDQLRQMTLQSSINARDLVSARLSDTKKRERSLLTEVSSLLQSWYRILPHDEDEELEVKPEWAFNAQGSAVGIRRAIAADRAALIDPASLEQSKRALQDALGELVDCLDIIHAPDSVDLHDPDLGLNDEQIAAALADLKSKAEEAVEQLPARYSAVERARGALRRDFAKRVLELQKRLRAIDDLIDERAVG